MLTMLPLKNGFIFWTATRTLLVGNSSLQCLESWRKLLTNVPA
uniref:Elongator complex protein 5 n=1 Tax=Rhizophora mucronata TaxID=61149 RepID=A0A2P2JCZ5_RHIMU